MRSPLLRAIALRVRQWKEFEVLLGCKRFNLRSMNMSGILRTSVYSYNAWWRTETTFLQKQKQGRLTDLTKAHFPFCFLKTSRLAMVWTFSLPQSCLWAARLAQSVEHQTFNLRVMGSSPISGDFFFYNRFQGHVLISFWLINDWCNMWNTQRRVLYESH